MEARDKSERSEFIDALQKGVLLGVAVLLLAVPPIRMAQKAPRGEPPAVARVQPAPQALPAPAPALPAPRFADFGDENPSADVRMVANWAVHTGDHQNRSLVIIDKKFAKVYVLDPQGRLQASAPALLGEAVGDDSAPGIGDKPLSQIQPHEKTTPAGRFVAEPGKNLSGEDVVWIDYDAAVSMHRIRKVKESERRFHRMATPTHEDNRISNGCVNLPVTFYENFLSPAVRKTGAIIYVLPETRSPQQVFGSFDVLQAAAPPAAASAQPARAEPIPAAAVPVRKPAASRV